MLRDSREDSLVDTYKTTPPMSHTDSPRGKIRYKISLFLLDSRYTNEALLINVVRLLALQEA